MGEGESAITERPFHIMNAVESMRAKLSTWAAACRGFWRAESIVVVLGVRMGGWVDGEPRGRVGIEGFCLFADFKERWLTDG